jgi:hypothetical protein
MGGYGGTGVALRLSATDPTETRGSTGPGWKPSFSASCGACTHFREGLAGFREKRQPRYECAASP